MCLCIICTQCGITPVSVVMSGKRLWSQTLLLWSKACCQHQFFHKYGGYKRAHGFVPNFIAFSLEYTSFSFHTLFVYLLQGRALSRAKSRRSIGFEQVLASLQEKGISIRVASPKLVMEEAPESYKNVTDVVNTC